jgi:hypothetical protein
MLPLLPLIKQLQPKPCNDYDKRSAHKDRKAQPKDEVENLLYHIILTPELQDTITMMTIKIITTTRAICFFVFITPPSLSSTFC